MSVPALLRPLLPESVVVVECRGDVDAPLFPQERAYLEGASAKRRAEFTTVRHCAGQALAELDRTRPAMVPGPRGEPTWPDDVVGSMTHCEGYRAAAVALAHTADALGIDAEPNRPLPAGVLSRIASPAEAARLHSLARQLPDVAVGRLLFSIKESIYKAWPAGAGSVPGFVDVEVAIRLDGGFTARLRARVDEAAPAAGAGAPRGAGLGGEADWKLAGRWGAEDDLLVTAVMVAGSPSPQRPTPN
ncbi:4'-phosphopantetheinyl transferase [Actinomyces sp. MRS3W]|uniref:4'-phosphopantetheinyl transferase family protein n=1 Tax=Actinomyces sp. MRS3W TaxID=2800796 RepID=UPI0028FDA252|nr:4'-phosphopantetheinyl transferase superfamily protein [Actinomyces sp. MRS3W]MDU0347915.1 4'-phosphopantetheinyl transferase superfamily protein [Actinomyces sp. MRS3W]